MGRILKFVERIFKRKPAAELIRIKRRGWHIEAEIYEGLDKQEPEKNKKVKEEIRKRISNLSKDIKAGKKPDSQENKDELAALRYALKITYERLS